MRSTLSGATIWGTGSHLPEQRRLNDWWPPALVEQWSRPGAARELTQGSAALSASLTPRQALVARHLAEARGNVFYGIRERRVIGQTERVVDMAIAAGRKAIETAGIDAAEIDLLLDYSAPPEVAWPTNAGLVQDGLGLSCMAMTVDSACSSFLAQLNVGARYIATGGARHVLVVTALGHSRLTEPEIPGSVTLGDGAGAVVLGPAEAGMGFLGSFARNDGRLHGIVGVVPERGRWYDGNGPLRLRTLRMIQGVQSMLDAGENAHEAITSVLGQVGACAEDVAWFIGHQPMPWFNPVAREAAGLTRAKTIHTYEWLGSMGAANIPVNLDIACRERVLKNGDLMILYSNGAGLNWAAIAMRWGRA